METPAQLTTDWNSYWALDTKAPFFNKFLLWAGGILTRMDQDTAWYSAVGAPNGGCKMSKTDSPAVLAGWFPGIAKQWKDQYGFEVPDMSFALHPEITGQTMSFPMWGHDIESNHAHYREHPEDLNFFRVYNGAPPLSAAEVAAAFAP